MDQVKRCLFAAIIFISCNCSCAIGADVTYEVLSEKVSLVTLKNKVVENILVKGLPTIDELEVELTRRYKLLLSRKDFFYHDNPPAVYIYAFGTKEQANAGYGLWVGMISPSIGSIVPQFSANKERLDALAQPAENRLGLTEPVRKKIYWDDVAGDTRATKEAMAQVSNTRIKEPLALEDKLQEKYRRDLILKYKLTEDQLKKIEIEGLQKGWPMP
jgi:hypothetical protein